MTLKAITMLSPIERRDLTVVSLNFPKKSTVICGFYHNFIATLLIGGIKAVRLRSRVTRLHNNNVLIFNFVYLFS